MEIRIAYANRKSFQKASNSDNGNLKALPLKVHGKREKLQFFFAFRTPSRALTPGWSQWGRLLDSAPALSLQLGVAPRTKRDVSSWSAECKRDAVFFREEKMARTGLSGELWRYIFGEQAPSTWEPSLAQTRQGRFRYDFEPNAFCTTQKRAKLNKLSRERRKMDKTVYLGFELFAKDISFSLAGNLKSVKSS